MKFLLAATMLILSINVFADSASKAEAIQVANMLINNAELVSEINKENTGILDYSVVTVKPGVQTFTFNLGRICMCMPKPGTLTITEDVTPTFSDGPIDYSTKLVFDN
jgi:ribosomal protein L1